MCLSRKQLAIFKKWLSISILKICTHHLPPLKPSSSCCAVGSNSICKYHDINHYHYITVYLTHLHLCKLETCACSGRLNISGVPPAPSCHTSDVQGFEKSCYFFWKWFAWKDIGRPRGCTFTVTRLTTICRRQRKRTWAASHAFKLHSSLHDSACTTWVPSTLMTGKVYGKVRGLNPENRL